MDKKRKDKPEVEEPKDLDEDDIPFTDDEWLNFDLELEDIE